MLENLKNFNNPSAQSEGKCPLDETDPMALLTKGSADFFGAEMKMLQTLFSGDGIDHHMELNCKLVGYSYVHVGVEIYVEVLYLVLFDASAEL